jgi:phenylpyruvate tautomerase PptA (4-oxalocrotonate tautomerase family)
MPYLVLTLQSGDFPSSVHDELAREVTRVAADAERIPPDAARRASTLVQLVELPRGALYSAGAREPLELVRFVAVHAFVPRGVLDPPKHAELVSGVDAALREVGKKEGPRSALPVMSSIVITEVDHGHWGVLGKISWLADFAARAGYEHLTGLVRSPPSK